VSTQVCGDKARRDLKAVQPLVDATRAECAKLSGLSHDELRARTRALKQRVAERTKQNDDQVAALRAEIENTPGMDIAEREKRWEEIDRLQTDSLKLIEEVLLEILPEAFAVVKETARRFSENDQIEVSATDLDR